MKKNCKTKKIYGIIRNKNGTSFPLIVAVTLVLTMIFCGISEYMRLMIVAQGVRDAVQFAVIATINDNYDDVYHGVREGYAAGYRPVSAAAWEPSVDYGDIYARLDQTLGLRAVGGQRVKYAGEAVEYRLSGLTVEIKNAPLAPSNPAAANFLADATLRLEVPVSFAGKILPPMRIDLKVQARYMPLF